MTETVFRNKLALIVPTRNRPDLLIKLLKTIETQTVMPSQVIIVDGSDVSIHPQIAEYLRDCDKYLHVVPPSLTRQRNAGKKELDLAITIAGYLDDDIELEPTTIEEMLRFWETCPPDTGGTEFNITNIPPDKSFAMIIRRFFCISGPEPGKVLRSGFCTSAFPAVRDHPCEWLCGGATIWSRKVLDTYQYDEWYSGWAYHEDAEFSYRIFKIPMRLYIVYKARLTHNPPPFNPSRNIALGRMAVINRYHFVKTNPELSVWLFYWSTIGEIFLNILRTIWERNGGGARIALGNIDALNHILKSDYVQQDINFRK